MVNDLTFKRPRVCILGCGGIGGLHAKNLQWKTDLYFCSRSRLSAYKFNTKFKGRGLIEDFEALVESDVDAVVVASPPEYHKDQVIALLEAGKAVLVEKPLCISPEEVAAIEAVVARVEKPLLMVAENYYYKPSLIRLKDMISKSEIGEVQSLFVKKLTTQKALGWKSAHGALLEGGIHFVAFVADLFDAKPDPVEAIFPNYARGPERESLVRMVFEPNVVAELYYSWQTPSVTKGVFQHSYIEGDQGRIVFESNGIYIRKPQGVGVVWPGLRDLMGYGAMTDDFLSCLRNRDRQPYSGFARAKRDLQIVFDAYACMES